MSIKVTLGGKALYTDSWPIEWAMSPGVRPDSARVVVPVSRGSEFDALLGTETTLRIESMLGHGTLEVRNLTVVYRDRIIEGTEPLLVYTLMDCRYRWGHESTAMVTGRFNHLLRLNDIDLAKAGSTVTVAGQEPTVLRGGQARVQRNQGGIAELVLADIVGQHQALPKFAYRELTLNADTGSPWTAYELIVCILNGFLFDGVKGILRDQDGPAEPDLAQFGGRPVDNRYPINRLTYMREPAPVALAALCHLARVRLYVNLQGKVRIIPADLLADPAPFLPPDSQMLEASQRLYMTDNRAWRAKKCRVLFPIERAVRFFKQTDAAQSDQTTSAAAPDKKQETPSLLKNVVRVPVEATIAGVERAPGEYVLIDDVCQYLGVSLAWLEKHAMADQAFLTAYGSLQGRAPENLPPTTVKWLMAMHAAHRTLYQIHEDWIKHIVSLSADSPVVIDSVTGKRAFAPAWIDFTILRTTYLDTGRATIAQLYEVVKYDRKRSGEAEPADDAPPSPFIIVIEDEELGIIRFVPATDALDRIAVLLPGLVKNVENILNVPAQGAVSAPNASFDPEFGCCAEVTVVSMKPNTVDQFHAHTVSQQDLGGTSAAVFAQADVMVEDETARFDSSGKLLNAAAIRVRAEAEARVYYQSWMDRLTGMPVYSGLHPGAKPFGHVASLRFVKAADGTLTTTVDCREAPEPPQVSHLLLRDPVGRALLHQQMKLPYSQS